MRTLSSIWWFSKRIATGGLIGLTISDRWFSFSPVKGFSMYPTLVPFSDSSPGALGGDVLLVEKLCLDKYKFSNGDVIILRCPSNHKQMLVKRLIALPGDWIRNPVSHDIVKIPEGHCWVEGDNSGSSFDSRTFGPVPLGLVKGRVSHVIWPPQRVGKVQGRMPSGKISSS
ncbi:peptidase S24/S26A/S26B/S26C family protein [Wolffia australiana]